MTHYQSVQAAEGGSRNFDESKHYLWPVPYQERLKNPSLGQNPGW